MVTSSVVVTAAHCLIGFAFYLFLLLTYQSSLHTSNLFYITRFSEDDVTVVAGLRLINRHSQNTQARKVSKIILHPRYDDEVTL